MFDLIIRGATVYDGSGRPGRTADVAVRAGRIAEVGNVDKGRDAARETVDAAGLALMPGIVDLHTHYDAQITWDAGLSPSPSLGVTTAILGNCGFGIAPCPRGLRETMMKNLSVVEGMELDVLVAGTRWEFETFAEYIELMRRMKPAINVGVFAQHSTVRTAVMGDEASTRRDPTAGELAHMQTIVREALDSGAVGFASSFSPNHSGYGGLPMPSTIAGDAELRALAGTLGEARRGVFMMATGPRATPEFMESIAAATGRPVFISTVLTMYTEAAPGRGLEYYGKCAAALARGHELYIQTTCQPLSFDFTLREPYILLSHDAFDRVKIARPEELGAIYADPAFRRRFRENLIKPQAGILFYGNWSKIEVARVAGAQHKHAEGRNIAELARDAGADPLDFFFDFALADGLETQFVGKLFQNDDTGVAPLLRHPASVVTLSDAGAHLIFMCDAGFGLYFLSHWVRETGTFTLEEGVRRLTSHPASLYRIPGRGRIEPGFWADLLLFDPNTVGLSGLERVRDLPGGGSRMIRRSEGVAGVWVNGTRVVEEGRALPLQQGPGQVLTEFNA